MEGEVTAWLLVGALALVVAAGPASAVHADVQTGSTIGPDAGDDPVEPVRRTWNRAMTEASGTIQPVQRTVGPLIVEIEEATGQDVCEADFFWDLPVMDEDEWSSAPLWCPGGEPSDGSGDPVAGLPLASLDGPLKAAPDRSQGVRGVDPAPSTQRTISTADRAPPIDGLDPDMRMVLVGLALVTGAALWLYRRLSKRALTDNPNRRRILAILREEPGRTCSELADRLDLAYGTVRYHLRLLEEFDHVAARRFGRNVRYYVNGNGEDATDRRVAAAMSVGTKRRILELLDEHGPTCSGELADAVGVARSTCSEHLKDLSEADLLERRCDGRRRLYDIDDDARASLGRLT